MSEKKNIRHFHAGKLRKFIDGVEFVEVAESHGSLFVSASGMFTSKTRKWKPTPGHLERDGYYRIYLNRRHAVTARIVYEVFVGRIPDGCEIDHINTIPTDNRVENLRAVTHRENLLNPLTRPRRRIACAENGRKGAMAQSHEDIMRAMRIGWEAHKRPVAVIGLADGGSVTVFDSVKEAAIAFGVTPMSIHNILYGKQRTFLKKRYTAERRAK